MPLTKQQRLWKEYRAARAQYHLVTNYLSAGWANLTKPQRDLLIEFADLAKREADRAKITPSLRIVR